jgi:hypothetical protein
MLECYDFFSFILFLGSIHLTCKTVYKINELATWYLIHSISNFIIVVLTINPILEIFKDPIEQIKNPNPYYDTMIIIILIHLYHLLFFKCNNDDIFHHLFFVGLGTITIYIFNNGYYSALSHFFICGLPGGIDYFFQFLYKINYIHKITRLKISMFLNVWIRSPGLCMVGTFSLINFLYSEKKIFNIIELLLQIIMSVGNGQMYMRDVVYASGKSYIY